MKNPLFIVLTALGAIGAAACIVLIVVILLGGNNRQHTESADAAILIPERFREISATADSLPDDHFDPTPAALPDKPSPPLYAGSVGCREMVSPESLKTLLLQRNLFCAKSPWSKQWAHPSGSGVHLKGAGLFFGDSVVTDSLTHLMWQRHSTFPKVTYHAMDTAIERLNSIGWQGYRNWRVPTVEELMMLLTPAKNRHGRHLPGSWNCRESDFWSCNPAADSLSVEWIWVVRMGAGRCNYGHPDMARSMLAVREY